ncbi:MAG TPA: hypothetical protein VM487_11285, partial [Phycisphaerae bacterium]|nr:hypothetical protein [Phycisphaerae bacterium]
MAGTSHEKYTADGKAQGEMVDGLRKQYGSLTQQQLDDYARVAAAEKKLVSELKRRVKELERTATAGTKAASATASVSSGGAGAAQSIRGMVDAGKGLASTIKSVGLLGLGLDTVISVGTKAIQVIDQVASE